MSGSYNTLRWQTTCFYTLLFQRKLTTQQENSYSKNGMSVDQIQNSTLLRFIGLIMDLLNDLKNPLPQVNKLIWN